MNAQRSLDAVRREIDAIDDAIHDLVIQRTLLGKRIAKLKDDGDVNLRPGREAAVLRRLMSRHRDPFPRPVLVRIWRELFSASMQMQGPFSVAVLGGDSGAGYWTLARDQYGSHTPMTGHSSASMVIDAVARGQATVGVLPLPGHDEADPWWPHLTSADHSTPRIIARLPFAGPGNGVDDDLQALVIGRLDSEPTGRDRALIGIDAAVDIPTSRLAAALADAGLVPTFLSQWPGEQTPGAWLSLAEVEGHLDPGDRRLARLEETSDGDIKRVVPLGGYAMPLSAEELTPKPPAKGKGKAGTKTKSPAKARSAGKAAARRRTSR